MDKKFIKEVFLLAEKYCGKDFSKRILFLRQERERILHNVWKTETLPEHLTSYHKDLLLRDIDFDTIIYHATKSLKRNQYNTFLYDVGCAAINHGELTKGKEALKYVLSKVSPKEAIQKADALRKLGNIEFYTSDFKTALQYFNRSLKVYEENDNTYGVITVNNHIGALLIEQGKYYEGEIHFIKARKIAESNNFADKAAKANMNLGNIYDMRGLADDAIACYQKSLEATPENDKKMHAFLQLNLAIANKSKNDYKTALKHLEKATAIINETGNRYQKGLTYLVDAEIACLKGNYSKSNAFVTSAFAIFSEIGDRLSTADAYKILGMINRETKNYDIALSYFENSRKIYEKITNPVNLAETLVEMAKLYQKMGEYEQAKKRAAAAIKNYQKIGADAKIERTRRLFENLD